jgi:A/G-specific adenine glycosylase
VTGLDAEERQRVQRSLLTWGRRHFQQYPWRHEPSGWLTLVAEVLLQRTQARQVVAIYDAFRHRFPTVADVVSAPDGELERVLFPLGLHSRAEVVRAIARESIRHGGSPPEDMQQLLAIRGVGAYTASAWLSLHRQQRASILDANIFRWLGRMTGRPYSRDPRRVRWVRELIDMMTPPRAFAAFNYALLDFTMLVCVPRMPKCRACPIKSNCAFAGTVGFARPRSVRSEARSQLVRIAS